MKIAMLGHKRIPSREGGIEIVVEQLAVRMAAQGHKVTCYNRKGDHVSGKEYNTLNRDYYEGVRLKNVLTIDKKGLAAVTASFSGAIKASFGKYDIVHFHAEGPCAALWLPKLFGKRCIATIHGLDHRRAKWGRFASSYIMAGEKCAVKYADEIIVLSREVQEYFKDTYGRDTVLIPNGVNRPRIRETQIITENFGLNKDGYILYLGRIVPEKGIDKLIQAFKCVKTEKKLVIAGGASDTDTFFEELKYIAKDDARITFTGFVQGELLDELYSNAYFYVLPSDLEGMPLSLLEAMSYGNCCLVSDISECTDVVEDKAVIFKRENSTDLIEKLQELCNNTDMVNSYKIHAADYICKKYNWDDVVEKTLALYEKGN